MNIDNIPASVRTDALTLLQCHIIHGCMELMEDCCVNSENGEGLNKQTAQTIYVMLYKAFELDDN